MPEEVAAEVVAGRGRRTDPAAPTAERLSRRRPAIAERPMSAATATVGDAAARPADALGGWARRNAWTLGLLGFLALLLVFTKLIQPTYGVAGHPGPRDLRAAPRPRRRRRRRSS